MQRKRSAAAALCLASLISALTVPVATSADARTSTVKVSARTHAFTDALGVRWSSGSTFRGGTLARSGRSIAGTRRDRLYQHARVGVTRYQTRLAPGRYTVRLYAAELRATRPGQRVFDVYAEGHRAVRNLDIYRAVGRDRAHRVTFHVTVKDGRLDLDFAKRRGLPKVSAIAVWRDPAHAVVAKHAPAAPSASTREAAHAPTTAAVAPAPVAGPAGPPSAGQGRVFAADGPFNIPVPADPALDGHSATLVGGLASGPHPGVANLYAYGVPVWDVDASAVPSRVTCTQSWGVCDLSATTVPIPAQAEATPYADDGAMVVVDWSTRTSYEFWKAKNTDGTWTAGWGGTASLDGPGTPGSAVGSGISRLAGVVRAEEMRSGHIDHALVFSTNNACRTYRFPASKSDGSSDRADCIPEGTRVQLDPGFDVASAPGLTRGERTVAKALQEYGAYAIDNGGANMAFVFETPSGEADPYPAVGFAWDYFGMDDIPWSRLRVLDQWTGR